MAGYQPRIDKDLLHVLWLKARSECRPLTKVLNRVLREALEKEDVDKLEARIAQPCSYCGRIHSMEKVRRRRLRVVENEAQGALSGE
jgi:hypothetical protein